MSDRRQIVDPELEWEADQSGVIHLRRGQGETEFLEGYGTSDFGVKSYEEDPLLKFSNALLTGGLAGAVFLGWKNRDVIRTELRRLGDYFLIMRESFRE